MSDDDRVKKAWQIVKEWEEDLNEFRLEKQRVLFLEGFDILKENL